MHPHFITVLRRELSDLRLWLTRATVLLFASLTGLVVVAFTWLTDQALRWFHLLQAHAWWSPLVWTPLCCAAVVWFTRRYVPGAAGSGIPQVMAAVEAPDQVRGLFVSLRLSLAKLVLTTVGLLGGLSLGREGPSVQIGAGIMVSVRSWLLKAGEVSDHGLMIAGGAAGIAAAFNTPLGGILFAIEELTRKPEQRNNGLIMASIVLGGAVAVSIFGNSSYFGVIRPELVHFSLLGPALLVISACGLAGGLFSRLLIVSLSGQSPDWFTDLRKRNPVGFAAACGLLVALIGMATHGETYGSGYQHTRNLLEGADETSHLYVLLKFMATWITSWSGVPGGIFAPSLAIGGALGHDLAGLTATSQTATMIALGMACFLAAVTQAPMTAFVIVMEMVDDHALILVLMGGAFIANALSRMVSAPLYGSLAHQQLGRIPAGTS